MADRVKLKERKRRGQQGLCPMCQRVQPFLWSCPCGFLICDDCMRRDAWGFTCNNITWTCPDCGEQRSY